LLELNPVVGVQAKVEPWLPAFKVVLPPLHTFTSAPKFTVGLAFIVTTTTSVAVQPLLVAVTVYMVVAVGFAVGFEIVALFKPVVGVQLYVVFADEAEPICADAPAQMIASEPAFTVGAGFTVTTTTSVAVHPFLDAVTVYVVVAVGFAVGLEIVALLKPVLGVQL
jgi:hypothetical protein